MKLVRCWRTLAVTDEVLVEEIKKLQASSDFKTMSLKIIRAKLSETLGQDMTGYRSKIKELVVQLISV